MATDPSLGQGCPRSAGERVCSGVRGQATELLGAGVLTSLFSCPDHRGQRPDVIRRGSGPNETCAKAARSLRLAGKQPIISLLRPR